MSEYYFKDNAFVIENYNNQKPFASFLPAISGKRSIPMWAYYVNRGQCISSFGIRDKNGAILEFSPANISYRETDRIGFRTFIKFDNEVLEAFDSRVDSPKRKMMIHDYALEIQDEVKGLEVNVKYFGLANETIGGLVRVVEVKNTSKKVKFDICDGLAELLPTGVNEWTIKHQANLQRSWMNVEALDKNVAYYKMNTIPSDEAETELIEEGNYYVSFTDKESLKPIYDANLIFGLDSTYSRPLGFYKGSDYVNNSKQVAENKIPVGFSVMTKELDEGESFKIYTIIGNSANKNMILNKVDDFLQPGYVERKMKEAKDVIRVLTDDVTCQTNYPIFDAYVKQCYLDNLLRGGYPEIIAKKHIYYLYSRRHGDLEREYNFFSIAPEFYSQGNGNFRDVCQNRRSDTLFHKEVGISNAKVFMNLIQLDGFNPLGVLGYTFKVSDGDAKARKITSDEAGISLLTKLFSSSTTPGAVINLINQNNIHTSLSDEEIFDILFGDSTPEINAEFGEGYWSDHWTYILDLIENTLKIFPDKEKEYLFDDVTYKYFSSPVTVLPRSEKYCITKHGKVRQFGSLLDKDNEKMAKLNMVLGRPHWSSDVNGNTIVTNLYGKLVSLAIMKFANLDSLQMGIEMDANKPGWNDAMNGLPGLFASGIAESIELKRICEYLSSTMKYSDSVIYLPEEMVKLYQDIICVYKTETDKFNIWDKVCNIKEAYNKATRFYTSKMVEVKVGDLNELVKLMNDILDQGLADSLKLGNGVYPTYLVYEPDKYQVLDHIGNYNLPTVKVESFKVRALPYFLEAPARSYKMHNRSKEELVKMYQTIKSTGLYDNVCKMYKTSSSIEEESYDIGRIRAFSSGWLERESNFLHMTYKYLLGLLKAHLYEEFFIEAKDNFVCFMDPKVYGRSTLENCSFLAPSNNPDPEVHGQGFVSRLSGSTAEMLSMYLEMMFGSKPFILNDTLELNLMPVLPKEYFKDGVVKALFLSNVNVEYHNPNGIDIYGVKPNSYTLEMVDGSIIETKEVKGELAHKVRDYMVKTIKCYF